MPLQSFPDSRYLQEEIPREKKQKHGEEEAINILKTRLAKGQKITKEEYHKLKKQLNNNDIIITIFITCQYVASRQV